jgi:carotenoid phi-ring synthase / carotenoid chi-ring synthase
MSQTDHLFPVVIIGAGLAGLTAAIHLADRGIQPMVLEADSRFPGGRICGGDPDTFQYNDHTWSFPPDQGMHALWGGYDNMRATLERFTDVKLTHSAGEEWINRWGRKVTMIEAGNAIRSRWLPAPFHYLQLLFHPQIWGTITLLDLLSLPGFLFSISWATGFDPIKEKNALEGLTFDDFFRLWTPNLKATFSGLGVNLLAAPTDSISLASLIAALRFYTVLRRDSWQLEYFPDSPPKSLIQPLIENIQSAGGEVMLGATVTRLEKQGSHWKVIVEDAIRGGMRSLPAKNIIMATDSPAAQRILSNSKDTAPEASKLNIPPALRNAVVRMWFDESPRGGTAGGMFTGDFVPDNFFWLHKLYDDFSQWHVATGGSAIEVHIYGTEELMNQTDNHLRILAVNDVQHAFPKLKGHLIHSAIRRNIRTHTLFRVPTADSIHVDTPWAGIYACGDWIGHPTPSMWMERSTVTAIAAANHILAANDKEPYLIIAPKRPEISAIVLGTLVRALRLIFRPFIALAKKSRKS